MISFTFPPLIKRRIALNSCMYNVMFGPLMGASHWQRERTLTVVFQWQSIRTVQVQKRVCSNERFHGLFVSTFTWVHFRSQRKEWHRNNRKMVGGGGGGWHSEKELLGLRQTVWLGSLMKQANMFSKNIYIGFILLWAQNVTFSCSEIIYLVGLGHKQKHFTAFGDQGCVLALLQANTL